MTETSKISLGTGCDIGTMNLISARRSDSNVMTKRVRDSFLELPLESKKMLRMSGVSYVVRGEELLILGDAALEMANLFGREARRPLSAGIVSSSDVDGLEVLGLLIKNVIGDPQTPGEHCYFSVPAAPMDRPGQDVIYHKGILEKIVKECGYTPHAGNEAMAIVFAETAKEGFSGLGISFGSGMTNIALGVSTMEAMSFSLARGGDWIDAGAAKARGQTQARMCALKEKGIDLQHPEGQDQEALVFYYQNLIEYVIDQMTAQFRANSGRMAVSKPIPMVISGGTSKAGGFLPLFKSLFEKKQKSFPIPISEIRHASDPLNAVAQGLLLQAMQEYSEE